MSCVVEWAVELAEFGLHFISTHAIKNRVLANFVVEWAPVPEEEEEGLSADPRHGCPEYWIMHFDSSLNLQGAGAGVVLTSPTREQLKYVVQLLFEKATNNMAEYEGLLAGLQATTALRICCLLVKGDSQLVVKQVSQDY